MIKFVLFQTKLTKIKIVQRANTVIYLSDASTFSTLAAGIGPQAQHLKPARVPVKCHGETISFIKNLQLSKKKY